MKKPIIAAIVAILLFMIIGNSTRSFSQKQKVWIDADTGNETDDIYAIARLLGDSSVEVIGVSSAHFNNADLVAFETWNQYSTQNINTLAISQQLNEDLLAIMGLSAIPHPSGADRQVGRAWGGREARPSEASRQLTAAVKKLKANEKIAVISLGALTNLASAIILDTSITRHLVCYILGAQYDLEKNSWNKNEFNIRNDLNAFDYLLDNPSVDLVMLPVSVARPFQFQRDSLYRQLSNDVPLEKMLKQRWEDTNPQDAIRTLWDLALVEAFLKPELATVKEVMTPPENKARKIRIYSRIDIPGMKSDFIKAIKEIHSLK